MTVRVRTIRDLLRELSKPQSRREAKRKVYYNNVKTKKSQRRIIKQYQRRNNGRHPNISQIPRGPYCYNSDHVCIFHYLESEDVGGCTLLNIKDSDLSPYSLLWDSCKECPFNYKDLRIL